MKDWGIDLIVWLLCISEATIALTLLYNIFESLYALKYPRQPLANPSSNAQKGKALLVPSPAPKRPYKVLSPFVRVILFLMPAVELHSKTAHAIKIRAHHSPKNHSRPHLPSLRRLFSLRQHSTILIHHKQHHLALCITL